MKKTLLLCALLSCSSAWAEEPQAIEPPLPPAVIESDDLSTADVTIIDGDGKTTHEYRRNGNLIMVRVQPDSGPAYYYFDEDGDGQLEHHAEEPNENTVGMWVLFQF